MARYQIETAKGPIIVEGPAGLSGPEVIDIYNDRLKTATSRRVSEFEGAPARPVRGSSWCCRNYRTQSTSRGLRLFR
jgi:hypothetical protein